VRERVAEARPDTKDAPALERNPSAVKHQIRLVAAFALLTRVHHCVLLAVWAYNIWALFADEAAFCGRRTDPSCSQAFGATSAVAAGIFAIIALFELCKRRLPPPPPTAAPY